MITQDQALSLIQDYVFDDMIPTYTFRNAKSNTFKKESYLLWAADELRGAILLRRTESPIRVMREFKRKMDKYARMSRKSRYPFDVAYDLVDNILDVCKAAGWED